MSNLSLEYFSFISKSLRTNHWVLYNNACSSAMSTMEFSQCSQRLLGRHARRIAWQSAVPFWALEPCPHSPIQEFAHCQNLYSVQASLQLIRSFSTQFMQEPAPCRLSPKLAGHILEWQAVHANFVVNFALTPATWSSQIAHRCTPMLEELCIIFVLIRLIRIGVQQYALCLKLCLNIMPKGPINVNFHIEKHGSSKRSTSVICGLQI